MFSFLGAGWCLVFFVVATACTPVPPPERIVRNESEHVMSEIESVAKLSMTSSAKVEGGKLVVDYTVTSNWSASLYVFDEMIAYDGQGKPKIDRSTAYAFYEEPSTLRLVRAVLNLPREKEVYALEIPYARELKPRGSLAGQIVLDLPVKEKSPFYAPPTEENSKKVDCATLRLLVGWTEYREGTKITEVDVAGEKTVRIRGSFQPFLLGNKHALSTEVIAHTTVFDRQMPQHPGQKN